jgi:hypothetical protein
MIEEKHVEKEEPQQITTSYTAILLSLQYALGQAPPSQPNQPASTRHAIPIQSIVITARKKMMPNLSARTISATTTFPSTFTATKATCAFVAGFPWR